ncbi:hypothetical protein OLP54_12295 [Agrobacterium sp. MAFF310724]|nr:hypothetical protein [Agrobacterium sp. MAFF310724]MDA5247766.1 hypothetical protein [Agrobacterium sp. MAFF210268]
MPIFSFSCASAGAASLQLRLSPSETWTSFSSHSSSRLENWGNKTPFPDSPLPEFLEIGDVSLV